MKRITRAQLRGKELDFDCRHAHTTTNEYGSDDKRVFCYGLVNPMNDEVLEKCISCNAYVGNAAPNVTTEVSKIINNKCVVARGRLTEDFIHDLDVAPEYRRKGFAQDIVRTLIQFGGRRLWVSSANDAAINLYKKLGFKIERRKEGYFLMKLNDGGKAF